jgi:hypothetical protein
MALQFVKAERKQSYLRLGLIGPAGSGKTLTGLLIAAGLAGPEGRIAVVDTENHSASKFAGEPDVPAFDVLELDTFSPQMYMQAIDAAEAASYAVLLIDSLSHAWVGKDGVLELVDRERARSKSGNAFTEGWRRVSPLHNRLVERMIRAKLHLIVTLRTKTEYVVETDPRTGQQVPKKVGLEPVQRSGLEYEFDIVGDLNAEHTLSITKSRCRELGDAVIERPTATLGVQLRNWLLAGTPVAAEVRLPAMAEAQANGQPTTSAQGNQLPTGEERSEEESARDGSMNGGAGPEVESARATSHAPDKASAAIEDPKTRPQLERAITRKLRELVPGDDATAKQERLDLIRACWDKPGFRAIMALNDKTLRAGWNKLAAMRQDEPPAVEDDDVSPLEDEEDPGFDSPEHSTGDLQEAQLDPEAEAHVEGLRQEREAAATEGETPDLGDLMPEYATAEELADVQRRYVASGYGENWAHAIKDFPGAPEAPQVPRAKYLDMLRVAESLEKIARPAPAAVKK